MEQYITSKLLWGNVYVLKARNSAGTVIALYVLDPQRVTVLVAPDGSVWYQLASDNLVPTTEKVTVPASEIIHDTMICLWHPLCGVSPLYACAMSATQGNRIQENSQQFFANMSRPSGILSAPGAIGETTAKEIKRLWESNFSGSKIGRLAVLGDGLTYEAMTIPPHDAQLIEQLEWTVRDVANAFHMPLYKVGGPVPAQQSVESLQLTYYTDCLQVIVESTELSFDASFNLPEGTETEFDLDALLRMDSAARYDRGNKAIAGGWLKPNEQRLSENYAPVPGGDSPMMQQQNWSLEQLAQRTSGPQDSPVVAAPPPQVAPVRAVETKEASDLQALTALAALFTEGLREEA